MSALPPKADIAQHGDTVRAFVPEVDPSITGMMSETCGVYAFFKLRS